MQYLLQKVNRYVSHETFPWLAAIIAACVFSIRYVIDSPLNYATGAYSDFTSFSLHLSDLLIICFIVYNYKFSRGIKKIWILPIIWILLEISPNIGPEFSLQVYFSARVVILIILAYTTSNIELKSKLFEKIALFMSGLGVLQTLIAVYQFFTQKSLGLYLLGESHLGPDMYGVAKLVAHGTKYIRGYGTFPHSNLLAAFLVISSLLNLYLLTKNYQRNTKILLFISYFINIFGVFITFSRAGISAMVISHVIFLLLLIIQRQYRSFWKLGLALALGVAIPVIGLNQFLFTRATIQDAAVRERFFYNEIGTRIVKDNFLFGTGPGTSVLHMEQYANQKLESWEIQPIHNYYLISFAEWGIGALFLLALLISPIVIHTRWIIKNLRTNNPQVVQKAILLIIILSFLYLFLFDHYFYTIWPTQVLLWLFVGLALAKPEVPHET